jgi:serine/threonine-protein kinase
MRAMAHRPNGAAVAGRARMTLAPVRGDALAAGRLVGGRYRLLERVGTGGTGVVHRARDERLQREVAVKLIAERHAHVPAVVRRFRREAALCARLAHPKIVAILDAGTEPEDFVVMELVRGLDAGALLESSGRLTPAQLVRMIGQVCEALHHAHGAGVLHRDVSPGNILVGIPDGTVKLADFGVTPDVTAGVTGTPGYVAPEVLRGGEPTPRSDLYGLGAVAYRLLAGPSRAAGGPDATAPTATAEPRMAPLAELRGDLPPALIEAVQRAVSSQPDRRQSSVAQFQTQISEGLWAPMDRRRHRDLFGQAARDGLAVAA